MIAAVRNLSKTYRQADTPIEVLRQVNLEIAPGESIAILGQSGSGKTTLLSLIAGLDRPDAGQVIVCGKDVNGMTEEELTKFRAAHLSIVFQQFHLMKYLNVLENVALPLELAGDPDAAPKAHAVLERVGLAHRLGHLPHQLSGGEKQRVAIARGLVTRPKLLLADEPSGNLDAKTGDAVMNLLFEQVKETGTALLLVTHNEALAERCDRRLKLTGGVLQ